MHAPFGSLFPPSPSVRLARVWPWAFALSFIPAVFAASPGSAQDAPTYYDDIAPLYAERCVQCHQAGGVGPFRLDNFDHAKTWGPASKAVTGARTMPPYLVTADGSCGEFFEPGALTAAEIDRVAAWVDGGMLEGTPRDALTPSELPSLGADAVSMTTPNFVPEIVGGELAEFDEYRCFLLDPELEQDQFITGFEVVPGNEAIVHHLLGFPVVMDDPSQREGGLFAPAPTNAEVIAEHQADSPDREGWPCFSGAGEDVSVTGVPVTWAPGTGAVHYPEGVGIKMAAGSKLVVQIHYNLAVAETRGQADQSTVRLQLSPTSERTGFFDLRDELLESRLEGQPVEIPPGEESFEFTFDLDYDDILPYLNNDLQIIGVLPHMHERGRTMRIERIRADDDACLAEVKRWDYNWQFFYFYQEPIAVEPGDSFRVTCTFNTQGLDEPVLPGWGTQNEMCLSGLMLSTGADLEGGLLSALGCQCAEGGDAGPVRAGLLGVFLAGLLLVRRRRE